MTRPARVRPVLKWAGGKTQLLHEILRRLPQRMGTYYEPFVGGGAVFFALAAEGRFRRAVLVDRNPDLMAVYQALQQDADALIAELSKLRERVGEADYYRIRAKRPRKLASRAARVIYLNKVGYNGLYRVNRSGLFNVPYGRHRRPKVCDELNLRAAAEALRNVTLKCDDFEETCAEARPGDAVYFDPPYLPRFTRSNFTDYHFEPFLLEEHQRLGRVLRELGERGVYALLSNSDVPETRELYSGLCIKRVEANRNINSKATQRGPVHELLVTNLLASPRVRGGRRARCR